MCLWLYVYYVTIIYIYNNNEVTNVKEVMNKLQFIHVLPPVQPSQAGLAKYLAASHLGACSCSQKSSNSMTVESMSVDSASGEQRPGSL